MKILIAPTAPTNLRVVANPSGVANRPTIAEFEARLVATGSPTSEVPFVNLRAIVAANGTFLLDAERLAALWGVDCITTMT